MQTHGIIFDCDGTLLDSLGHAMESFNYTLAQIGAPARTASEIKRYFGTGADRILTNLLNGDSSRGLEAFEIYVEHQAQLAQSMKLHEGIPELLERLFARQVPMAIVTGRHSRDLAAVLNPQRISQYFLTAIGDNHLSKSKPDPEGILLACQRLGLKPSNVCYVGDSVMDLQAAHQAGATAIAALWDGLVDPIQMRSENPRFLAQKPPEVWTAFEEFKSSRSK